MLTLRKPSSDLLQRFLEEQSNLDFSYSEVGATASSPPEGYNVDRTRIMLGAGEAVFRSAKAALQRWEQCRLGWVETWPRSIPIRTGQVVGMISRVGGCWWLNCGRIIYVVDEAAPVSRYGFAYGTLPGHVERGEERFLIEWDQATGEVCYDILAFSRPNHPLVKLAYPWARRCQKRFGRESAASMVAAAASASTDSPSGGR